MDRLLSMIMLKPDALETYIPANVATSLFCAFANHLNQTNVFSLDQTMSICEKKAELQIYERSLTEPNFQGLLDLVDESTKESFTRSAQQFSRGLILAADIITTGIISMGYEMARSCEFRLSPYDVDEIYSTSSSKDEVPDLAKQLHEYLDNKIVVFIKLFSRYGDFLLQRWKTFVRHFLILERTEEFPLVNLIHVCENDREYVNRIFYRQNNMKRR